MNAKEFPFICGCGYNTMDVKSASEHIAECPNKAGAAHTGKPITPKPSHTATPWEIEDSGLCESHYITSNELGYHIGVADLCVTNSETNSQSFVALDRETIKANAEHIVKCVNSHDALVGACNDALEELMEIWSKTDAESMAIISLKSALKQAGEDV